MGCLWPHSCSLRHGHLSAQPGTAAVPELLPGSLLHLTHVVQKIRVEKNDSGLNSGKSGTPEEPALSLPVLQWAWGSAGVPTAGTNTSISMSY